MLMTNCLLLRQFLQMKKSPIESFNNAKKDILNLIKKINEPLDKNSLELQNFKTNANVFKNVKSNTELSTILKKWLKKQKN